MFLQLLLQYVHKLDKDLYCSASLVNLALSPYGLYQQPFTAFYSPD